MKRAAAFNHPPSTPGGGYHAAFEAMGVPLSHNPRTIRSCRMLAAVILMLAGVAQTVLASALPTVKIGNQVKNAVATVIDLNQGDISCYLRLKDDAGREFSESAIFELCNMKSTLEGKRVALTYGLQNVQSAECQGDPNCKKFDRVALVTAAKVIGTAAAPAAITRSSLCTGTETVVFACPTGAKWVSVCASRNLSPVQGYAQFRIGHSLAALEVILPKGWIHPRKVAYGKVEEFPGGDASWLRFRRGSYAYVVYRGVGRRGADGATTEKYGMAVEHKGKIAANHGCTGKYTGELGPHWFEKAGFQPQDNERFQIPE